MFYSVHISGYVLRTYVDVSRDSLIYYSIIWMSNNFTGNRSIYLGQRNGNFDATPSWGGL